MGWVLLARDGPIKMAYSSTSRKSSPVFRCGAVVLSFYWLTRDRTMRKPIVLLHSPPA